MARGFTDIEIRNMQAGKTRREIPDPGASNLYVVIQPSGKKSFAVRYRVAGRPRKLTLSRGLSLAAARKLAADALLAVEQGRDPAESKKETRAKLKAAEADTVQALCENYLKREGAKLRTEHARKLVLERLIFPEIGGKPLTELKRGDITRLLDKIEDTNGTKMADLALAYIRKVFSWHAGRVDDFNSPIVKGMSRYDAKANEGTRVLSDDELQKIWAATEPSKNPPQPFHALIRFLLLTGARRSEANLLPWSELSADGKVWTLTSARNKVKTELVRPLSKAAQSVLASVPPIEGAKFVFGRGHKPMHLSAPTVALKTATGTNGWRIHDLRRTSRSLMSRAGVPADHAERCLGHSLGAIRKIYDKHKYEAEMLAAYEALATLIDNIVTPRDNVVQMVR